MDEIEHFGFIPNGGRIYYLNRSQPPVFINVRPLHTLIPITITDGGQDGSDICEQDSRCHHPGKGNPPHGGRAIVVGDQPHNQSYFTIQL